MINLYGDYFIDADENNFMLRKKILSKKKDSDEVTERFVPVGYFSSIDRAYAFFVREIEKDIIMDENTTCLRDFITKMNEIISHLTFTIKEYEELKLAFEMKFD